MDGVDDNPRPLKRHRSSASVTSIEEPEKPTAYIQPANLLLSIPSLVIHPPSHQHHAQSVALAQHSLRRCLQIKGLDQILECRAWTGLAELGYSALISGNHTQLLGEVEKALTKALLIAQKHPTLCLYVPRITQLSAHLAHFQNNTRFAQHSLRRLISSFSNQPPHIHVSAQLALIHSLSLDAETSLTEWKTKPSELNPALAKCLRAVEDLQNYSLSLKRPPNLKLGFPHPISLLSHLLRLQLLVRHGVWSQVQEALRITEEAFELHGLVKKDLQAESSTQSLVNVAVKPESPTPASNASSKPSENIPPPLLIQALILSVHVHTYFGDAAMAAERLRLLHALIDDGVLANAEDTQGIYKIPLADNTPSQQPPSSQPFYLRITHPRIVYILTFLLSAAAKRDAVGRKPRKAVFAREGLAVLDRELGFEAGNPPSTSQISGVSGKEKEVILPAHAPLADMVEVRTRMVKIKADLFCEIVNVSTMRSEFKEADQTLNQLIAHTRTYDLFPEYAARITLLQAQLAHSLGQTDRALQCYDLAAWLAEGNHINLSGPQQTKPKGQTPVFRDEWVRVASRAGALWVRIGVLRKKNSNTGRVKLNVGDVEMSEIGSDDTKVGSSPASGKGTADVEMYELRRIGKEVVAECAGMGGTLAAVGELLASCLHVELWGAKQHLRRALELATKAQDNHLRALILALSASHYLHTSRENALTMLGTCEQIVAGLGASAKKSAPGGEGVVKPDSTALNDQVTGNVQMRLWVGERTLELHKWAGDTQKSFRQSVINRQLQQAVERVEKRPLKRPFSAFSA